MKTLSKKMFITVVLLASQGLLAEHADSTARSSSRPAAIRQSKINANQIPLGTKIERSGQFEKRDCQISVSIFPLKPGDAGVVASNGIPGATTASFQGLNNASDYTTAAQIVCSITNNQPESYDFATLVVDQTSKWAPEEGSTVRISGIAWSLSTSKCGKLNACPAVVNPRPELGCAAEDSNGRIFKEYSIKDNCEAANVLHQKICKEKLDPSTFRSVCYERK